MAKKYKIVQKLNLNGKPLSIAFSVFMDKADLDNLLALLEGGYEVSEVIESNLATADTLVANTNPHTQIGLVGSVNGKPIFETIKPYSGAIHFKNTASNDDITNALATATPFELFPVEKPKKVTFKGYETVVVAP
ncbi:hypothetical protein [Arcobacter ellisii]|jgi:hypothetical protein|uniref:Uncharacterized protein n=1 Tax=Arcobacter ellisii TaxID=913109 RepID=A0A347U6I4_9BACT|nr:hypothetical protein [Arcobacter ellisii]AXX94462.1 hypothetical protein AELL_0782 [Arcobacter ellisii]RXI31159.1 hypothetical protein CP962_06780 [Arcobacter ellisii]